LNFLKTNQLEIKNKFYKRRDMKTVTEIFAHITELADSANKLASDLSQTGHYAEANAVQRKAYLYRNLLDEIQISKQ
jgi:hypothetical protein